MYTYKFPMFSLTADILYVVNQEILLIRRKNDPHKGKFAFPGGFVNIDETLEQAAIRELREETGIVENSLDFMMMADRIDRDTRGRVLSAVFLKCADKKPDVNAADDAASAEWVHLGRVYELGFAFDHAEIYEKLYERFS